MMLDNSTETENDTTIFSLFWVCICIRIILCVVGVLSNMCVITVGVTVNPIKHLFGKLLISLAALDALSLTMDLVLFIPGRIFKLHYSIPCFIYQWANSFYLCDMFHMISLLADRIFFFSRPFAYDEFTYHFGWLIISFIWICGFFCAALFNWMLLCYQHLFLYRKLMIAIYLFALITVIYLTFYVYCVIRKFIRQRTYQPQSNTHPQLRRVCSSAIPKPLAKSRRWVHPSEVKIFRVLVFIVLFAICSWATPLLYYLLIYITKQGFPETRMSYIFIIYHIQPIIPTFHSFINPFLYSLTNKKFRRGLFNLLFKCHLRKVSHDYHLKTTRYPQPLPSVKPRETVLKEPATKSSSTNFSAIREESE